MTQTYLLAETHGTMFALPADRVVAVASVDRITPVPLAERHVAGIAAIRSQVLTVIDVGLVLGGEGSATAGEPELVVVEIDDHSYGLAVDDVHDVIDTDQEPARLGAPLSTEWRRISEGILDIDGKPVIAANPAAIVEHRREIS